MKIKKYSKNRISEGFLDWVSDNILDANQTSKKNSSMERPVGYRFYFTINSREKLPKGSISQNEYEEIKVDIVNRLYDRLDTYLSNDVFEEGEYFRIDLEEERGSFNPNNEYLSLVIVCDSSLMKFLDKNKIRNLINSTIIEYKGIKMAIHINKEVEEAYA